MKTKTPIILLAIFAVFTGCHSPEPDVYGVSRMRVPAPRKSLRWFKNNQNPDGSWGSKSASSQLTPLVLLAFLEHVETPSSHEFGETCLEALQWLEKEASNNNTPAPLTAWAICLAYGFTEIPRLEKPAEKQLKLIIDSQQEDGSFKYNRDLLFPAKKYNTVLHCIYLISLNEAYMCGLGKDEVVIPIKKSLRWLLKNCFLKEDKSFSLFPGEQKASPLATAMSIFTLGSFGVKFPEMRIGLDQLHKDIKFDWDNTGLTCPVLTWYCMTKAIFNGYAGMGEGWKYWNRAYTTGLVKHQNEAGYWFHPKAGQMFSDKNDKTIFCTALSTLMLEVYYAYLPTYKCNRICFSFEELMGKKQKLNQNKTDFSD